jgi:hypothetical protein
MTTTNRRKITRIQGEELRYRLELNEEQNEINKEKGDSDRLPVWGMIEQRGKSFYLTVWHLAAALDDIDEIIERWTDQIDDVPDECVRSTVACVRSMKGLRDKLAPPAPPAPGEWEVTFKTVSGRRVLSLPLGVNR